MCGVVVRHRLLRWNIEASDLVIVDIQGRTDGNDASVRNCDGEGPRITDYTRERANACETDCHQYDDDYDDQNDYCHSGPALVVMPTVNNDGGSWPTVVGRG